LEGYLGRKKTAKIPKAAAEDGFVRPTVKVPKKLHKEVLHAVADRDVDQQRAYIEGILLWLAGQPLPSVEDLDEADQVLVATLPKFIKEADPERVEYVRQLIRAGLAVTWSAKP
jgi:hypothetical protein